MSEISVPSQSDFNLERLWNDAINMEDYDEAVRIQALALKIQENFEVSEPTETPRALGRAATAPTTWLDARRLAADMGDYYDF